MLFDLRLFLAGVCCTLIGIWWFIDGLTSGFMSEIIGGLVWKGPLLGGVGVAAAVLGYRMFNAKRPGDGGPG